jgi:mono/diheme cytochrome c family protein
MTRWLLIATVLGAVAGCDSGDRKGTFDDPVERGRFVYMRWCAGCHGPNGGGAGPRARGAKRPPPDLRTGSWDDDHLRRVIRGGIEGTIMPPMPVPDEDLDALVTYVQQLSAP